jgi:hypothetical protein
MKINRAAKAVIAVFAVAALAWSVATAGLYAAMLQPPETFGAIMKHMPMIGMMVLPFTPLWMSARSGTLHPGDVAPDFELRTIDGDRLVKLSSEYRQKPVVLVFGSYT